jgi:hypothetical protein
MGIEYASEKFSSAIYAIVTSDQPESVQDRAFTSIMATSILSSDDMPALFWERFENCTLMTCSHFLSQTKLEVLGSDSPLVLC